MMNQHKIRVRHLPNRQKVYKSRVKSRGNGRGNRGMMNICSEAWKSGWDLMNGYNRARKSRCDLSGRLHIPFFFVRSILLEERIGLGEWVQESLEEYIGFE